MKELKIYKKDLILWIMIFFAFKIGCISYISTGLNLIWYLGQVFSVFIAIYFLIMKKKICKFDISVIIFYLVLLISTIINKASLYTLFKELMSFFPLYFTTRYGIETNCKQYLKYSSTLLLFYNLINTFTAVYFYPNAMIRDNMNPVFFMGGDNTSIRLYIISICLSTLNKYQKNNIMKIPFIPLLNLLVFSTIRDIGTGKVCFIILLLGCLFVKSKFKKPNKILKYIILFNILFFFLIVIFNKLSTFEFFIVNILHRNLTLTDRTVIWNITINKIIEKPMLGYGMIDGLDFQAMLPYIIGINAHNTYLMVLFDGGIILFTLFIIPFVLASKKYDAFKHIKVIYIIPFSLLALMIRSQVEGWDVVWLFYILLLCYFSNRIEENIKKKEEGSIVND